jgi:hypothetical protein
LDRNTVESLLRKAIHAAHAELVGRDIPEKTFTVTVVSQGGEVDQQLKSPDYLSAMNWEVRNGLCDSSEAQELTRYLWSMGACKRTLHATGGPAYQGCDHVIWLDLVFWPLHFLLSEAALRSLCRSD